MSDANCGEKRLVSLKVLYTLHGVASQKFVVKPAHQVEARVFDASDLGIVSLQPCLEAIRHSSPDYAEICDSSANDYAIYTVDYAEDGLPLQGHGRVSEHVMTEVTGKLKASKLLREQLELQIHLLPIRVPPEPPVDHPDLTSAHGLLSSQLSRDISEANQDVLQEDPSLQTSSKPLYQFPTPPASLNFGLNFPSIPGLPDSLHLPRSDPFLPSSPPVRARPTKIGSSSGTVARRRVNSLAEQTPAKRTMSEASSSGAKKKKQSSPGSSTEAACGNCGVASASTWRRVHVEGSTGGDTLLCNACGLYYKTKNIMRPSFLWDRSNRLGSRLQETPIGRPPSSKPAKKPNALSVEAGTSIPSSQGSHHISMSHEAPEGGSSPDDIMAHAADAEKPPIIPALHDMDIGGHLEPSGEVQHPLQLHLPETPSTPKRGIRPGGGDASQEVPSSIEKLFLVTPDGKKTINIHLPGSGSAGKWLNRMMNTSEESSYFESFLASPTPKKNRQHDQRTESPTICSSPPTSSTLFSELPDWSIFPTSPSSHKLLGLPARADEPGEVESHVHMESSTKPI